MTNDDEVRADPAPGAAPWPQPHPSPPLPPPREYGSPGTPKDPRTWLWAVAGAAVVGLLISGGLAYIVSGLGEESSASDDPGSAPTAVAPTEVASTPTPEPSPTGPPAPYRCWDGEPAQALDDCSLPTGEEGLRWVFPNLSKASCGDPEVSGPGVVARVLCRGKFSDGSPVVFGYYEWESVDDGVAFYESQGLTESDAPGFLGWTGRTGDTLKAVLLYADAPFSQTVTLPAGATTGPDDGAMLTPRAPEELRGEPVG